jgi:hypothetical protein
MFGTRFGIAVVLSIILSFIAGGYIDQAVSDPFFAVLLGGCSGFLIATAMLRLICK